MPLHINAINANAIPCSQGNVGHHLYISFSILNGQIRELRVRKNKLNRHKIIVYGEVMRSYTPYTPSLWLKLIIMKRVLPTFTGCRKVMSSTLNFSFSCSVPLYLWSSCWHWTGFFTEIIHLFMEVACQQTQKQNRRGHCLPGTCNKLQRVGEITGIQ